MNDEIEVTVAFNGPDEYRAYNDAPVCLRELIYRQARELAEAASALRSSGEAAAWVACSDRLPELRDDGVIAYFSETDSPETVHIEDYFRPITAGTDADGNQAWTYWYLERGVTHWMPLPTPPASTKGG